MVGANSSLSLHGGAVGLVGLLHGAGGWVSTLLRLRVVVRVARVLIVVELVGRRDDPSARSPLLQAIGTLAPGVAAVEDKEHNGKARGGDADDAAGLEAVVALAVRAIVVGVAV